jgi:hypothetical protein
MTAAATVATATATLATVQVVRMMSMGVARTLYADAQNEAIVNNNIIFYKILI